ncbi:gamma-glutamyltransferase family protein, partial [Alloalcanivorax gelatiniphagus]
TVAGTISGWQRAGEIASQWGGRLPLTRLLEDAHRHARDGIAVTPSQAALTAAKLPELGNVPGFADSYLVDGQAPAEGRILRQAALADTLARLGKAGLDDFYRGELASAMAEDLARVGSPVSREDLAAYHARVVEPLSTRLRNATLYNQPPPTQGMASLMILGLFDRLGVTKGEGFDHLHGLVEATKQAFLIRDRHCTDPAYMDVDPADFLTDADLAERAARIDPATALPWPQPALPGDTIWMGCIDREGRSASFIQSIYWEFGSGVVLPSSGVLWQNRGISFSLDPDAPQALKPGRKPFHTLNPAMARFDDGRTMVYGTMGGEGQPQTQAAVFSRYGLFDQPLQQAVTAPRWLLGRTWGDESTSLKLEARFEARLVQQLRDAGHQVEVLDQDFSDTMGHAGAVVRHPDGVIEGASDPRSDGVVATL